MKLTLTVLAIFFLSLSASAHTYIIFDDIEDVKFSENSDTVVMTFLDNDESSFPLSIKCGKDSMWFKDPNKVTLTYFYRQFETGKMEQCQEKIKEIQKQITSGKKIKSVELKVSRQVPSYFKIFDINPIFEESN